MIKRYSNEIKVLFKEISYAISVMQHELRLGEFADEDDITSQLISRLSKTCTRRIGEYEIFTKAFKIKSRSEEPVVGADILIISSLHDGEFWYSKSVLIQAKILRTNSTLSSREWSRLTEQSKKMLIRTIESYILLYSDGSFRTHKAAAVLKLETRRIDDLFYQYFRNFLMEFLICKAGDPTISLEDQPRLSMLLRDIQPKHLLVFSGSRASEEEPSPDQPLSPLIDDALRNSTEEAELDLAELPATSSDFQALNMKYAITAEGVLQEDILDSEETTEETLKLQDQRNE